MKKQLNFNQFPEMQEMHMKILDLDLENFEVVYVQSTVRYSPYWGETADSCQ